MAATSIGDDVDRLAANNDDSTGAITTETSPSLSDDSSSTILNGNHGRHNSSSVPDAQTSTLSELNKPSSIPSASGNDKQIFGATSGNLVQQEFHPNNLAQNTLDSSLSHQNTQNLPTPPNHIPTLNSHPSPHLHPVLTNTSSEHLFHPRPSTASLPTTDIGITRPFTASPLISPHDSVRLKDPTSSYDFPRRFNSMNSRIDNGITAKELISRKSDTILVDRLSDSGLFTPKSSPLRPHFRSDSPEPFPTHDLNEWHKQPPKETHSADIDVDPVSGRKIINEYEIVGELGRGVHGKVKLGRNLQTGTNVAIKIIERVSKRRRLGRTGNQEAKIKREIAILKKARHKNIVGLLEVIDDPAMKKVYIVLEHVELGEVKWRTHGEDEICTIEYRRHLREAAGITENDAAEHEDHLILENARKYLERREIEFRDQQRKAVGTWSLEHGDTGSDINFFSTKEEQIEPPPQSKSTSETSTVGTQDQPTSKPVDPPQKDSKRLSDTFKTSDYHTAVENHTPLGGTMYGPYDDDEQNGQVLDRYAPSNEDYDIGRLPEHFRQVPVMTLNEARKAIRDTVLGLEYLHYQGVIHRDIKPANLLMTKNRDIKISDFGVSYLGKTAKDQGADEQSDVDAQDYDEAVELAKTVGTPAFYAPELCRTDCNDSDPPPVTNQIDVWALGVTLYCFVFGRVPFHDHNTFVLMKHIAEQDLHIPRRRLKAVEDGEDGLEMASPSPLSPTSPTEHSCNKRYSHELDYEEVSDELKDLLKRLLTKDPRERIKLDEVKHHPWLLDDIKNPSRWIDENDPSKFTHGKKIEVSKEDVESAVRLNVVDNIRKLTKKVIGGVMGLGKSHSRTRAKSTTTVPDSQASSAASSSSNMSQDARYQERRRGSLRPDELIFSAIKASRESDHPLSHSVTASPKSEARFEKGWDTAAPGQGPGGRPVELERGMSATGSVRTIRPGDFQALGSGSYTTSALPSTPLPIDTPATPLGGIFGGVKNLLRGGSTSDSHMSRNRSRSISRKRLVAEDAHGEPSLAISNTLAAGLVNLPAALQNIMPTSTGPSPNSSRPPSALGLHDFPRSRETTETGLSRASSLSSVASRGRSDTVISLQKAAVLPLVEELTQEALDSRPMSQSSIREREGTAEEVNRAKEEQLRRLIQQDAQSRKQSLSERQEPASVLEEECPPSPDDYIFQRHRSDASNFEHPPLTTPHNYYQRPAHAQALAAGSSEGHLTSEMSQSTSNRSLPSAYSASSSYGYVVDHALSQESTAKYSSTGEFQGISYPSDSDILYEEASLLDPVDDGEDSDDSFIEMSRPKRPCSAQATRTTSVSSKTTTQNLTREDTIP